MAIPLYLAQTAAEFASNAQKPKHIAWMACHFSPYGTGITGIPKALPEGSLLILNDRTPVCGHDPEEVSSALIQAVQRMRCSGILLDFQRRECQQTAAIAAEVVKLSCPVAVSEYYAQPLTCPVFLSATPPHKLLSEHIAHWQGREIWLEAALNSTVITVTESGSRFSPVPYGEKLECPFHDERLHCRYRTEIFPDSIRFTLTRTKEDLTDLLEEAETLGITQAIGLHQELGR